MTNRLLRISKKIISAISIFVFFLFFLSFFGKHNWILDVLSHFKLQYFCILFALFVISFFVKNKILTFAVLTFTIIVGIEVFSIYFGGNKNDNIEKTVKIVCANVLTTNKNYLKANEYITEKNPDILVLLETSQKWIDELKPFTDKYPYKKEIPADNNFGIAIYSKIELQNIETPVYNNQNLASITAFFEFSGEKIKIIATHPKPPLHKFNYEERNNHLNNIALSEANRDYELILIGDLNLTSYSVIFKSFCTETKLTDSRKGFGFNHSWHLIPFLTTTTLDHCLVSENIFVKKREVGYNIGSDHKPVYVELGFE